jgi:hypothetical protein
MQGKRTNAARNIKRKGNQIAAIVQGFKFLFSRTSHEFFLQ